MLPGKRYTPEDVLQLLWRRKWVALSPLLLSATVTALYLPTLPDLFRSETLIMVVPQRVPDSYVRATVTSRIEDRLQTISQQILSRTRLEPIVTEFQLYPSLRQRLPMEDIIEQMRRDITVQTVRGDTFRVSYVAPDPAVAQRVTERLSSLFIEENLRDREVLAEATDQFLESQLEDARKRLVEHEKRLESYRLAHAGELPTQAESTLQTIQSLQSQVQGVSDSLARDRDRRLILQRSLADLQRQAAEPLPAASAAAPPPVTRQEANGPGVPAGSTTEQLAGARQVLANLQLRLTPEHPDVQRMQRVIRELEEKVATERKAAAAAAAGAPPGSGDPAPVRPGATAAERRVAEVREEMGLIDREVAKKEAQLSGLQDEIQRYRARLEAMPTRESEMTELMRDYDTLRGVYTSLLAKREDSKVAANLERRQIGEQFRILDPARRPERPFSPNRPQMAALGIGIGLLLGVALLAGLEFRDKSFHRDEEVTALLGLPVLATVPRMWNPVEEKRRRLARWSLSLAGVASTIAVVALVAWRLVK